MSRWDDYYAEGIAWEMDEEAARLYADRGVESDRLKVLMMRQELDEAEGLAAVDEGEWEPPSILDGVDLDAPPLRPDVLGLLYCGKMHLVSGRPETAKSWFGCAAVYDAVGKGGGALLVDTDGTGQRDLADRLVGMGLSRQLVRERVRYYDDPNDPFGSPDGAARLVGWVERMATRGPVVVVIDSANPTITALGHQMDEAGFTSVEARVIAPLKRASAYVVVVDHLAIHAAADSPYSIGTQRKHAAADVHLRMTAVGPPLQRGGAPATVVITGMKDRPGGIERRGTNRHVGKMTFTPAPDGSVAVEVDLSAPTVKDAAAVFRPTVLMERVSRWAERQPDSFSKTTIERNVEGKGTGLRQAVDVLFAEGYFTAERDRYRSTRSYRQADDPEALAGWDDPPTPPPTPSLDEVTANGHWAPSPRPASSDAVFGDPVPPQGRARPWAGGGCPSPPSPPLWGDGGRPPGSDPDGDWRDLLPEGENGGLA